MAKSSSEKWDYLKAFAENGGFNFLSKMEESYNCASLCSVPLFYMTKTLENGRPTRDCLSAVMEDLGETPAGYITLLTGLLLLITLIGSCPLCGSNKAEEGSDEVEVLNKTDDLGYAKKSSNLSYASNAGKSQIGAGLNRNKADQFNSSINSNKSLKSAASASASPPTKAVAKGKR